MKMTKLWADRLTKSSVIRLNNVAKRYGYTVAVDSVSLQVKHGEILALLGPSGCGKTSTLRLIAGLEKPDWGEIWLRDNLMSTSRKVVPSYKRQIGMVFQDLALWPHMTAAQHIKFALLSRNRKKSARQAAVCEILSMVRMDKIDSFPHQLSGGERQRLAIGRALASEPQILIMDEPFSSLDRELKEGLFKELKKIINRLKITTIYVTHQYDEALCLADRIAVMANGKIVSCDSVTKFADQQMKPGCEEEIKAQMKLKIIPLRSRT